MDIKNVVLLLASNKKVVQEFALCVETYLTKQKIQVHYLYSCFEDINDPPLPKCDADMLISIGGDGTVLKAVHICMTAKSNIPILPIKVGDFGFISEIQQDEWQDVFEAYQKGDVKYTEHPLISTQVGNTTWYACNEITVYSSIYGTIQTRVHCNNEFLANYRSDGLIISTPVGSTAHSLSSGGPILMHGMKSIIINPIAPFTLSHRPLVMPIDYDVDVEIEKNQRRNALLIVDGRVMLGLYGGARISVKDAGLCAKIITSNKRSYFEILRNKFKWTGSL